MSDVTISLTADEALVLFEWLAQREEASDPNASPRAEDLALWSVKAGLDRLLTEPFAPNYHQLVESARSRLTQQSDN